MSSDPRAQIEFELESLTRLFETYGPLIELCRTVRPDPVEISALGAMLHSFYNGIENILKRLTKKRSVAFDNTGNWHAYLLRSTLIETPSSPSVLTEKLYETLREYLAFRHVFRNSYSFELDWGKMENLVFGGPDVLIEFKSEILLFLDRIEK